MKRVKLNYKRTLFVGFAFFLICAFWQAYDNTIPLILTNKFGLSQTFSGVIMALDNILALFMLPLFGAISDRYCSKKLGKRTPFILVGTMIAAVAFVALSFTDGAQLKNISEVATIDDTASLQLIYESQKDAVLQTPSGDKFVLSEKFTEEQFTQIPCTLVFDGRSDAPSPSMDGEPYVLLDLFTEEEAAEVYKHAAKECVDFTNPHYSDYVVPARQAYAWQKTVGNPSTLVFFIALLLVVLISMAVFRSPAVALMPDVTIKPLRSKANAIINLMGSAGGILVLVLGMVFATGNVKNSLMPYTAYFSVIAGIMLLALLVFMLTVREPKFVAEMEAESKRYGIDNGEDSDAGDRKLSKPEFKSLLFLLASIVFWYMGYNAVTSKYSVYATNILNKDYNLTLILAQAAAIISYLPVGIISSKIGRKKAILAGVVMLTAAFAGAAFMTESSPTMLMNCIFCLAGIGWATINVNSFPMVVEMSKGSDVGKYTGIYYTASMAAQTVTPMFSGYLMDKLGMRSLFPYAAVFAALAFVTMLFVMHGDNKPTAKKGLEALDVED